MLIHDDVPPEESRIQLRDCTAYLMRLVSDKGRVLGILTALAGPEISSMPYPFCRDLLQPALRSLSRELSLRMYLLDTTTRLNSHGDLQEFLKLLGDKARASNSCGESLRDILELTIKHLMLDGAVFLAPQHSLRITVGENAVPLEEAQELLDSLQELSDSKPDNIADALASRPEPDPRERSRSWPILEDGKHVMGVLVLSRPANMAKLTDDSRNIVNFVVSTIEHVIERGFDQLTGLINWPGFETSLAEACGSGNTDDYSLMFLDMDRLQVVNDNFGRDTGDEVLAGFVDIIRAVLPGQLVARVTGDNFAALLSGVGLDEAQELGQEICRRLRDFDYAAREKSFRLSASIGVAPLLPREGGVGSVLIPAQVACQAAKDRGRGRCEKYIATDATIVQRMDDFSIVGSLQSAIEGGRMVLYAQPIKRLSGEDRSSHHEILVRMLGVDDQPIEPAEFLGTAERYQLMQELDRWVVSRSLDSLRDSATDLTGKPLHYSVNLSGQSLGDDEFLDFIREELLRTAVSPARLCFEITETVAVKNLKKAQLFMDELKQMGCRFSLDDFGTGLSSFAYLKLFAVDRLKIDGSFIREVSESEVSRSMVSAIVEIARVMGIQTVAEYVENEQILDTIRDIGIDWGQGYFLGKPVRLKELLGDSDLTDSTSIIDLSPSVIKDLHRQA
jgi:diguanylate cyclase (GGDEF)-like protein